MFFDLWNKVRVDGQIRFAHTVCTKPVLLAVHSVPLQYIQYDKYYQEFLITDKNETPPIYLFLMAQTSTLKQNFCLITSDPIVLTDTVSQLTVSYSTDFLSNARTICNRNHVSLPRFFQTSTMFF